MYVVAPDSSSANGKGWRWKRSLDELEPAELPAALVELARAKKPGGLPPNTDSLGLIEPSWVNLVGLDVREDIVRALLRPLGVPEDVPLGRTFHCVMHDDVRPSATLFRLDDGTIAYHCFAACGPGRSQWFSLAAVRARQAGRRSLRLGRVELALWKLDLLERAGLVEPVIFETPEVPQHLALVMRGFLRLLGLRWLTTPGAPAPFARAFAAPWCGLLEHELRAGFVELRERGLIRHAGVDPRGLSLWLPGEGVRPIA
jgi:hypothetical protein